jgi:thiamine pyrophosphokinase
MGIAPSMIIGDGDSIDPAILPHYADVPFRKFPKLKNETDLELAVQSVFTPEVEKIGLFGVLGDRTDHSLANLHLIRRYPGKVFIESETETVFASCNNMDLTVKPGQTISLIHIDGPVQGVTTQGLQWELKDACFDKYFFSVSNICLTDRINISIRCGELLCILQK